MKSKEDDVLRLFFNSPTRHWHFEEILDEAGITRSKADRWLKDFSRRKLIKRVKRKGSMPYYVGNHHSSRYRNMKRIFSLNMLNESGLLDHLSSLDKARTVILFGSLSRWDWHAGSDIDVFLYGNPEGLRLGKYEMKLHRDIQLFVCRDRKALSELGEGLIKNIIKGDLIKGDLGFIEVGVRGRGKEDKGAQGHLRPSLTEKY
ncbi:MAG: nucleotidyltransferase domain-containing protein [Nanoarchaeota archaeon]|nr:nucleotidyltransferase domain-containing protein [Nanoarchaeota archaeon]